MSSGEASTFNALRWPDGWGLTRSPPLRSGVEPTTLGVAASAPSSLGCFGRESDGAKLDPTVSEPNVIETERLALRRLTLNDLDAWAAIYSDEEVLKYFPRASSRMSRTKEELEWIINVYYRRYGFGLWGPSGSSRLTRKATGQEELGKDRTQAAAVITRLAAAPFPNPSDGNGHVQRPRRKNQTCRTSEPMSRTRSNTRRRRTRACPRSVPPRSRTLRAPRAVARRSPFLAEVHPRRDDRAEEGGRAEGRQGDRAQAQLAKLAARAEIGYALSSEECRPDLPRSLRPYGRGARIRFALISDHFHPWTDRQGQSPFVWRVSAGSRRPPSGCGSEPR